MDALSENRYPLLMPSHQERGLFLHYYMTDFSNTFQQN